MIGAQRLGDFAARLEKAGESGDVETLENELGNLLYMYKELVKDLEPIRDRKSEEVKAETNDERPLISEQDMKKAYEELSGFCASFDYDNVVNIVQSLEDKDLDEIMNEWFSEELDKAS